jgi:hypothetical protein
MIPKSEILIKYTSGNELVTINTNTPYQGYYYETNNKIYAGKEFQYNAPELVKISQSNKLYNNSSTALFSYLSGVTSQQLSTPKLTNIPNDIPVKFYCRKTNEFPIIIKEIDENTYSSLQQTPIYKTAFIGTYKNKTQTIDQAEKEFPGIKDFLLG